MAFTYNSIGSMQLLNHREVEKRQLFLRSYQFSRKQSVVERIKKSFFRVGKAISLRFRSARRLRKMIVLKFKNGLFFSGRRRRSFRRLRGSNYGYCGYFASPQSSCLW